MNEEEFRDVVISKLDRIANLIEMKEKREIDLLKVKILGRSVLKRDVYGLIDGKRSVQEIANMLKAAQPNVSRALSEMENGNLIGKKVKGKSVLYFKKFED